MEQQEKPKDIFDLLKNIKKEIYAFIVQQDNVLHKKIEDMECDIRKSEQRMKDFAEIADDGLTTRIDALEKQYKHLQWHIAMIYITNFLCIAVISAGILIKHLLF